MSKALYRKYRSKSLDEVVGQRHITEVLKNSLKKGVISHAYLLTGPRGVGKTSIARILAHEINGLPYEDESSHLDIIEIDAASNNGVEDVRDLREKVQIAPSVAKKKVYIIDEVHMLSKPAFNALLKTLEEPPEHVVFILATTDADKLPATIVSRTQRFSFRPITPKDTIQHLAMIAKKEKLDIDEGALELIARRGQGSFRDSISLLDQVSSLSGKDPITSQAITSLLGLAPSDAVSGILEAIEKKNLEKVIETIDKCEETGVDISSLASELALEIKAKLPKNPALSEILSPLLEVYRSSDPYLKLIAVAASFVAQRSSHKSVALSAPMPSVSAPIKELEKAATKTTPKLKPQAKVDKSDDKTEPAQPEEPPINQDAPAELNWESLVEHARQNFIAIYSVLTKCSYELAGNNLTIYAGNSFYKKKLDDTRYRVNLSAALRSVCSQELIIEVLPSKQPPKDKQLAAVAAIMGGGEEVSVEI